MTNSDRILARGVPITLADGRTAHLRYGMLGLKQLEDDFGSLAKVQDAIKKEFARNSKEGAPTGKAINLAWSIMRAGLLDLEMTELELDRVLDPALFGDYADAIGQAFDQAFGDGKAKKGQAQVTPISPGPISTISPPLSSTDQIESSG